MLFTLESNQKRLPVAYTDLQYTVVVPNMLFEIKICTCVDKLPYNNCRVTCQHK